MIDYLKKFSLEDKTAYVAGGAGLIGTEVSKALAAAGAKTVIVDTNDEKANSVKNEITKAAHRACLQLLTSRTSPSP